MHIAIAGNIGSGKTSLTQLLSKHYRWKEQFEYVENNPYLNDFYEDMQRWAFHMQIYYLNIRFAQLQQIKQNNENVIQDRTIYEDAHIFAPNLYAMGLMTKRDFENYSLLFQNMELFLSPPDLIIYLRASLKTVAKHIQKRGREYEENIHINYISQLNERYEAWISTYNKGKFIIIDIDESNFMENDSDLKIIIDNVNNELKMNDLKKE